MGKFPLVAAFCLASLCAMPLSAQNGGMRLHGIPASVGSIGIDGRTHGIPASVTSPTFDGAPIDGAPIQFNRFGPRDRVFVPVYIPYAAFPYSYDAYYEPQPQPQPVQVVVQPVIIREVPESATGERRQSGDEAQGDEGSRYGKHYLDSREQARSERRRTPVAEQPLPAPSTPKTPAVAVPEELPVTMLIFRDGHHGEVRNYAIVGENLIDLGNNRVMKKIPLNTLDLPATKRENEQNGIEFHLP